MANKLPCSEQSEKFVITCALANKEAANLILVSLNHNDFTLQNCQFIYDALQNLSDKKKELDLSSIGAELEFMGHFSDVGGSEGLDEFISSYISNDGLNEAINTLLDKTVCRNLILKMNDLESGYYAKKFESDDIFISNAENEITRIASNRKVNGFRNLSEIGVDIKKNILSARAAGSSLIGYDTGFADLNKITLGFSKGELIIIAARPSVGKTALGLNIAFNVANKSNKPVIVFSLEMSEVSLGTRLLAGVSNIDMGKLSTGNVSQEELLSIEDGIKVISRSPLYIDNTAGIKINDIIAKARKFKAANPNLAMILVDYLGLVSPDKKYENLRIQIGALTHAFKSLALELEVPVVVISQLSRGVENRNISKRPELQDLRESGDIEQDADKVLLLYREDYYNKENNMSNNKNGENYNSNPQEKNDIDIPQDISQQKGSPSIIEVDVKKNRNGATKRCFLWFFKAYSRFNSVDINTINAYKALHKLSW